MSAHPTRLYDVVAGGVRVSSSGIVRGARAHACVLLTRRGGSGRSSVCVTSTLQRRRVARLKTSCFQVEVLLLSLLLLLRCPTSTDIFSCRCRTEASPTLKRARSLLDRTIDLRDETTHAVGAGTTPILPPTLPHHDHLPRLQNNKQTNKLVSSCTAAISAAVSAEATRNWQRRHRIAQSDQVASRNTRRWRHRGLATTARRAN